MNRNLKTVATLANETPFSEHSLRWHIFNRHSNGMDKAGAIVRVGRRIYIDVDKFDAWIAAQNPPIQQAAQ